MDRVISELTLNEEASIIKLVNKILTMAVEEKASDIHFEPYENNYRIRLRQDGLLFEIASLPANLTNRITTRLKVMSNLDISERRLPQDGRFKLQWNLTESIDFRVNICPTMDGEKIVVRMIKPHSTQLDIETLGLNKNQKNLFLTALKKPQGMILVTGPTGCGKTATLYSALALLNTQEKNIITVEDPVEIKMTGINQVSVNPKIGLTFSTALRAFLRQDPDIIMVGEIRDLETAEIAIKAAQTGHIVFSTIHANDTVQTLTRLVDMGIPTANLVNSINLLIAQRLARRLCEHCKAIDSKLSLESFNQPTEETLYQAIGCTRCSKGYRGQIGLFEVLPLSHTLKKHILSGVHYFDVLRQAQTEGMLTMHQSGLEKVKQGLTTLEEINRVVVQ